MHPLKLLLFCAALLLPVAALASINAVSPCRVEAVIIGGPNWLNQYRLEVRQPLGCPQSWARIRTRNGGIVPPIGYFKIGGIYPAYRDYFVFKGAKVERRLAPNVWVNEPIKGAPWNP